MLNMIAKRTTQVLVGVGSDQALFGLSLPSDSVLHDVRGKVHVMSEVQISFDQAIFYGFEMYLLPVLDPDAAANIDSLWDTLVPKQTDTQGMDLDTGAADATPFYEPGEADWSTLLDVGLKPERLYRRERLLTMTDGAAAVFQDNQSPFTVWPMNLPASSS